MHRSRVSKRTTSPRVAGPAVAITDRSTGCSKDTRPYLQRVLTLPISERSLPSDRCAPPRRPIGYDFSGAYEYARKLHSICLLSLFIRLTEGRYRNCATGSKNHALPYYLAVDVRSRPFDRDTKFGRRFFSKSFEYFRKFLVRRWVHSKSSARTYPALFFGRCRSVPIRGPFVSLLRPRFPFTRR